VWCHAGPQYLQMRALLPWFVRAQLDPQTHRFQQATSPTAASPHRHPCLQAMNSAGSHQRAHQLDPLRSLATVSQGRPAARRRNRAEAAMPGTSSNKAIYLRLRDTSRQHSNRFVLHPCCRQFCSQAALTSSNLLRKCINQPPLCLLDVLSEVIKSDHWHLN